MNIDDIIEAAAKELAVNTVEGYNGNISAILRRHFVPVQVYITAQDVVIEHLTDECEYDPEQGEAR